MLCRGDDTRLVYGSLSMEMYNSFFSGFFDLTCSLTSLKEPGGCSVRLKRRGPGAETGNDGEL